jgi:hypothetical protein
MLKDSINKYRKMMAADKGERKKLCWEAVERAKCILFVSSMHSLSSTNLVQQFKKTYLRNSIHLASVFTD